MSATYMLAASDYMVTDGVVTDALLHDLPASDDRLIIAAAVASGDFFATLAAALEQAATALPRTHHEQYRLQVLVDQLLYLQTHYKIVKK